MKRILSILLLVGMIGSVSADNIDYRALLLRFFTTNTPSAKYVGLNTNTVVTFGSINTNYLSTNGFVIQINTNLNSSFYQFITNSIVQNSSPQVWTNDGNVLFPLGFTNVALGDNDMSYFGFTPFFSGQWHQTNGGSSAYLLGHLSGDSYSEVLTVEANDDGGAFTGNAFAIAGYLRSAASGRGSWGGGVSPIGVAGEALVRGTGDSTNTPGVAGGVRGFASTTMDQQYAVGGVVSPIRDGATNVASYGRIEEDSHTGVFVGGYFEMNATIGADPTFESSTLLLDNRDTGSPLIVARTNNGAGLRPFKVLPDRIHFFGIDYFMPLANALPGQVWASSGGTPQQLYWTNLPAGFGGVTNFATTNTSTLLTNAIISIAESITNGASGSVTSVGMTGDGVIFSNTVPGSPVTSAGTLIPGLLKETANKVLAGPISGATATPTFRSIAAEDLPIIGAGSVTLLTNANVLTVSNNVTVLSTNSNAGITNIIDKEITNQIPNFINGRTNYIALFNPNTNTVSQSILFQTNGTTDIGMRNGDSPDGSAALSLKLYGHYGTEATRDWLDSKWSVGQGDYEIMTDKGASGTARALTLGTGGIRYWTIGGTGVGIGDLLPVANAARSIGANSDGILNMYIEGFIDFEQNGTAGVAQIGNTANANGAGFNFQGGRIGIVNNNLAVDIIRLETGTITPPTRRIVDIGSCILATGPSAGSRNSWFGQDQLNTGNRWMFGTNNLAATSQPAANQVIGSAGSGSHIYGGDLGIYGGPSTGSGTNGALIFGTAEGGAAISTLNTPKIRFFLAPEPVILTESSATLIGTISNITAGHFAGAVIVVTTDADDATDFQCVNETFSVAMVNKGGTLTTSVSASAPSSTITSSGTLTTTITAVANVNGCDLKVNAVSSLTQTTLKSRWRIQSVDCDVIPHVYDSVGKHL